MAIDNSELIHAIEKLKAQKVIKRDSDVAAVMSYSKGVISEYINNKRAVSELFMRKFYEAFPKAKKSAGSVKSQAASRDNARFIDLGAETIMQVPLVNKFAYAGYTRGYGDDEYIDKLPTYPFLVDKEYKGKYLAFEIKGDSMDDDTKAGYSEGEIVLAREIGHQHWQSKLHIGKWDFVIVTKNEGILIKKISKHDTATGDLLLHSLNNAYDDIKINLNDVAKIFNIVQVVRKK